MASKTSEFAMASKMTDSADTGGAYSTDHLIEPSSQISADAICHSQEYPQAPAQTTTRDRWDSTQDKLLLELHALGVADGAFLSDTPSEEQNAYNRILEDMQVAFPSARFSLENIKARVTALKELYSTYLQLEEQIGTVVDHGVGKILASDEQWEYFTRKYGNDVQKIRKDGGLPFIRLFEVTFPVIDDGADYAVEAQDDLITGPYSSRFRRGSSSSSSSPLREGSRQELRRKKRLKNDLSQLLRLQELVSAQDTAFIKAIEVVQQLMKDSASAEDISIFIDHLEASQRATVRFNALEGALKKAFFWRTVQQQKGR